MTGRRRCNNWDAEIRTLRTILSLILVLILVTSSKAFSSSQTPPPSRNLFGLEGPGYNFSPLPLQRLEPSAQTVLDKLGIQSSMEPALLKAPSTEVLNLLSAATPLLLRAASGVFGLDYQVRWIPRDDTKYAYIATKTSQLEESCVCKAPPQPIVLYSVESSNECRLVREACSMLSLNVRILPVPKGGKNFAPEMKDKYRVTEAPCLVDPNTSIYMSDTKRIVDYLFTTYGTGKVPWTLRQQADEEQRFPLLNNWAFMSSTLAVGLVRWGAGGSYQYSNPPPRMVDGQPSLIVWAYEGSPYCKVVQETLSSLELEHMVIYTPRGSPNRARLWRLTGRVQVPYLQDVYTGVSLFESSAIVEYLQKKYGIAPSPIRFM